MFVSGFGCVWMRMIRMFEYLDCYTKLFDSDRDWYYFCMHEDKNFSPGWLE